MSFETTVWTVVGTTALGMTLALAALWLQLDIRIGIGVPDATLPPDATEVRQEFVRFLLDKQPASWPPPDEGVLDRQIDWSRWQSDLAEAKSALSGTDADGAESAGDATPPAGVILDRYLRSNYGVGIPGN